MEDNARWRCVVIGMSCFAACLVFGIIEFVKPGSVHWGLVFAMVVASVVGIVVLWVVQKFKLY